MAVNAYRENHLPHIQNAVNNLGKRLILEMPMNFAIQRITKEIVESLTFWFVNPSCMMKWIFRGSYITNNFCYEILPINLYAFWPIYFWIFSTTSLKACHWEHAVIPQVTVLYNYVRINNVVGISRCYPTKPKQFPTNNTQPKSVQKLPISLCCR